MTFDEVMGGSAGGFLPMELDSLVGRVAEELGGGGVAVSSAGSVLKWSRVENLDECGRRVLPSFLSHGPSGVAYAAHGEDRFGWVLTYYKSGVKWGELTRHSLFSEVVAAAASFEAGLGA